MLSFPLWAIASEVAAAEKRVKCVRRKMIDSTLNDAAVKRDDCDEKSIVVYVCCLLVEWNIVFN